MDSLNNNYHEHPSENLKHTIDIYSLYSDLSKYFSQYGFFHKGSSLSFASDVMHHLVISDDSNGTSIDESIVADTANIRNSSVGGAADVSAAIEKEYSNVDF